MVVWPAAANTWEPNFVVHISRSVVLQVSFIATMSHATVSNSQISVSMESSVERLLAFLWMTVNWKRLESAHWFPGSCRSCLCSSRTAGPAEELESEPSNLDAGVVHRRRKMHAGTSPETSLWAPLPPPLPLPPSPLLGKTFVWAARDVVQLVVEGRRSAR